jgi:hypothetical protein
MKKTKLQNIVLMLTTVVVMAPAATTLSVMAANTPQSPQFIVHFMDARDNNVKITGGGMYATGSQLQCRGSAAKDHGDNSWWINATPSTPGDRCDKATNMCHAVFCGTQNGQQVYAKGQSFKCSGTINETNKAPDWKPWPHAGTCPSQI